MEGILMSLLPIRSQRKIVLDKINIIIEPENTALRSFIIEQLFLTLRKKN